MCALNENFPVDKLPNRLYTAITTIIITTTRIVVVHYKDIDVKRKVDYLNNKDMLAEIHKSKISFCECDDFKHTWFDGIHDNLDDIFEPEKFIPADPNDPESVDTTIPSAIDRAKIKRAARIADQNYRSALATATGDHKPKLSQYKFDPMTIEEHELVFRIMTYEHIPLAPGRKKNPKTPADHRIRLNYIPFKHYVIERDSDDKQVLKHVLTSHWHYGEFSLTNGSITNKLAKMFMLMVAKYSQRSNWRGYTYLDEMKGQALLQLSQMGLQFNEAKSDNPFSYYTASVANSFTRVLNIEKKNQNLRDDLLVQAGKNPSSTRQLAIEEEIRKMRESAASSTD